MTDLLHLNDRPGQYPPSFYASEVTIPPARPALQGDVPAEVAILGAGFTGLSAALHLARAGIKVVVVEAQRVGFGASGRNGGQCGSGYNKDQIWLEQKLGHPAAQELWSLTEQAKALVRRYVAEIAPEAGWQDGIIHAERFDKGVREAAQYAEHLRRHYGYDAMEPLSGEALRDHVVTTAYSGGVLDHGAGHIQPLALSLGLAHAAEAAGAVIYETSQVTRLDQGPRPVLHTAEGRLQADTVLLAGNGYLSGLLPDLSARIMPINSFIVATEPLGAMADEVLRGGVAVADDRFVVKYFRLSPDGRMLFGGRENYGYRFPENIESTSRKRMLAVFPQLEAVGITHAWGGTLGITSSRLPVFCRFGGNIYAAAGFSGHGVALANLAGQVMAEAVRGQGGDFDRLAALPASPFPGGDKLRSPLLMLAMSWYALRDRLGV